MSFDGREFQRLLVSGMQPLPLVEEFHIAVGHPTLPSPSWLTDKDVAHIPGGHSAASFTQMRYDLIAEELEELRTAMNSDDLVGVLDALADLQYVIIGLALTLGLPLEAAFAEVHRSNMTKMGKGGSIRYRADGKIEKPRTFEAPRLVDILAWASA